MKKENYAEKKCRLKIDFPNLNRNVQLYMNKNVVDKTFLLMIN